MLAALAAVGASEIKARWLQPLLFLLPALAVLIARVDGAGRAWRGFLGACAALGLTWLVLVGARAAYQMGRASPDEWNLPLPALALALRDAGFSGGVIVSPNAVIAAGLRLQFPDARAVVAAYPLSDAGGQPQVFVQADNHGRPLPPWPLAQPARTVRLAFLYARPDSPLFEARFAVLPAAPAPINDDTP
ncbi:MAG: hypothetical protein ACUVVU_05960 [Tepidimonas sp.]|uniref:hypothetical protein n=1 Tax=Tepidimonas sp. TaxID=2002775 RepID=UPI00405518C7